MTSYTPYTFKLQGTIDSQADSALSGLEDLLQVKGYDWLEDYMAGVERIVKGGRAGASGALSQILKTPSRTPRVTRTALAKEKMRVERVKRANADADADADAEVDIEEPEMGKKSKVKSIKAKTPGKKLLFAPIEMPDSTGSPSPASPTSPTKGRGGGAISMKAPTAAFNLTSTSMLASSSGSAPILLQETRARPTPSSHANPFLVEGDDIPIKSSQPVRASPAGKAEVEDEVPQIPESEGQDELVNQEEHESEEEATADPGDASTKPGGGLDQVGHEDEGRLEPDEQEMREEQKLQEEIQDVEVEETGMKGIAQGLDEVTLNSPAKARVEVANDEEAAEEDEVQVDAPIESEPTSPSTTASAQPADRMSTSSASQAEPVEPAVEEKKRQTEFMIPLRDSTTPVKSTTDRKSAYGAERQTPVSFSPSSVAFAALPSRDPLRGKSVGGKRMTIKVDSERTHVQDKQEEVKENEEREEKSRQMVPPPVKSVRIATVVSEGQIDAGPASAPAATPAPTSRHASSQPQQGSSVGPASQGNPNKKSGPGVRSSWLRQAMANAGGEQGVRKSMAGNALRKKSEFEKDVEEVDEDEERDEEREEVQDDVMVTVKEKTEPTKVNLQAVRDLGQVVPANEVKELVVPSAEVKHLDRQPLDPISASRQLNQHALDMPLAAEAMPQSKLARMIADLEEKKAAAALAASTSRMTLGGQAMNGQSGVLGGATGWNPLRSTLGGLRLRDEASGTPKEENPPISLLPKQEVPSEIGADVEADGREQFSKIDDAATPPEAVVVTEIDTGEVALVQAVEEEKSEVQAVEEEKSEADVRAHAQAMVDTVQDEVVVTIQQRPAEIESTTPTASIYPDIEQLIDRTTDIAREEASEVDIVPEVSKEHRSSMVIDTFDPATAIPGGYQAFSTPIKQDNRTMESTTPMASPPRAFRSGAFAPHQARGPSHLQNASLPPIARPGKISMMRADSADDVKTADEMLATGAPPPTSDTQPQPKASLSHAQTPPSQPLRDVSLPKPTAVVQLSSPEVPASRIPPTRSGLSASTAQVVPDDDEDDETVDGDQDELESSDEEVEEEREEENEDIEEAVALLTKDMRLGDDDAVADSEAPSDEETATEKPGPGPKRAGTSSLTSSKLGSSTTSKITAQKNLTLASSIARKIDGQRPVIGQIDSLMKAQQAREKDAAMTAARAAKQEARDQRKRDEMRERALREKAEQEAKRKEKLVQQERLEKLKKDQERKRKEAYERGIVEKEKAALAASQKKAKLASAPKEIKRPAQIHAKPREPAAKPAVPELNKSTAPTRPHPIMKTIIPTGPLVPSASAMATSTTAPSRPLGAPSKPSLANAGPVRPAKASMQAGLQRPILNSNNQQNHPGMRNSTIVPGGADRKTVTPAQAGGVFAVGGQGTTAAGKPAVVSGEQDTRGEDIELPDIDSDYGLDSESEDDAASWAASPALRRAIDQQGVVDPARLFGPMPEFKLEDVFINARAAKRPRSSSANWSGQDRLTEQEKLEYAKRMNYRDDTALIW